VGVVRGKGDRAPGIRAVWLGDYHSCVDGVVGGAK